MGTTRCALKGSRGWRHAIGRVQVASSIHSDRVLSSGPGLAERTESVQWRRKLSYDDPIPDRPQCNTGELRKRALFLGEWRCERPHVTGITCL
jgi:hypothetical protein